MRWQHELSVAQEAALIAGKEIMRQPGGALLLLRNETRNGGAR